MDGQLGFAAKVEDTLILVREIRATGFGGPMIAASTSPYYNLALIDAGCSVGWQKNWLNLKQALGELMDQVCALLS